MKKLKALYSILIVFSPDATLSSLLWQFTFLPSPFSCSSFFMQKWSYVPPSFFSESFMLYTFFLPPSKFPPPFCRTLSSCSSLTSWFHWSKDLKLLSLMFLFKKKIKWKSCFYFLTLFEKLHPWSFLPWAISLHKLPVCLPLWASLYPPPLPPLTSPPFLQLSFSLPELTLSLAFALTGQSPRAEHSHLYLILHLRLSLPVSLPFFLSLSISTAIHPFISVQPSG